MSSMPHHSPLPHPRGLCFVLLIDFFQNCLISCFSLFTFCLNLEAEVVEDRNECIFGSSKFLVIGHRGYGMNILQSSDPRFKFMKENSIRSFNAAARFPIDFIEFDVQVRDISTLCLVRSLLTSLFCVISYEFGNFFHIFFLLIIETDYCLLIWLLKPQVFACRIMDEDGSCVVECSS